MADRSDQDEIISEKLKLLKISSLKTEQKQAVVGVLIQTLDSVILQWVSWRTWFSPDAGDFNLPFQHC